MVNFAGFELGEIVNIPESNDLPRSYFDDGFLVPLEKEEVKKIKKVTEPRRKPPEKVEPIGSDDDKSDKSANIV